MAVAYSVTAGLDARSTPHPLGRGTAKLSVSVPHGIKRKLREEDQLVPILQDFLIASMRESESNLGCSVGDPKEGTILIGAVPTKSAICAGAAVATKAIIGLWTCDSKIDWKFRHGSKEGCSNLPCYALSRIPPSVSDAFT